MSKKLKLDFRVSLEEKEEIKRLAKVLGYKNVSDYLSSIALSGLNKKDRVAIYSSLLSLRKRNAMVENNINQIAKHLNVYKGINDDQFEKYLSLFSSFNNFRHEQTTTIKFILRKLNDS